MTRKTYMLLVNYLRKSRLFILPITLATALSGCALTQNKSQNQSDTDSNITSLQEQAISSKETERPNDNPDSQEDPSSQSLKTVLGITQTDALTKTPVSEWQTLEQPDLPPHNVWDRLLQNFQLDLEVDNPRIQAQLNWYKRHPKYLERMFARAALSLSRGGSG